MKIISRAHDIGTMDVEQLFGKVKETGFDGVQLVISKALSGSPRLLDQCLVDSIAKASKKHDCTIAMLGAYFNPLHSNKQYVSDSIEKFVNHLSYANDLGCAYVGSETGSLNDDKWTYNPLNHTQASMDKVCQIFGSLADKAKQYGSNLAIEGAYAHCCYTPLALNQLLRSIDNGHVYTTVDIYNYLFIDNYTTANQIFNQCIELFGDKIVIFHLKDFIVDNGKLVQVALGEGLMDYPYILSQIVRHCPNAYLVFEGIKPNWIASSMKYIKGLL